MIKEDPFVELAGLCSKTCHVLEAADDLDGFSKHIEDLGRCVGPACSFPLIITSRFRIMSTIELVVGKQATCPIDLREHLRISTEESVKTWREELWRILSSFGVCRCQPMAPVLQPLNQGDSMQGNSLQPRAVLEHVEKTLDPELEPGSAPAPVMARLSSVFPALHALLTTQYSLRQFRLLANP